MSETINDVIQGNTKYDPFRYSNIKPCSCCSKSYEDKFLAVTLFLHPNHYLMMVDVYMPKQYSSSSSRNYNNTGNHYRSRTMNSSPSDWIWVSISNISINSDFAKEIISYINCTLPIATTVQKKDLVFTNRKSESILPYN